LPSKRSKLISRISKLRTPSYAIGEKLIADQSRRVTPDIVPGASFEIVV